jgi:hypothetical protein
MMRNQSEGRPAISPDMSILDVVSRYRSTETVFKQYDEMAGVCLCCQALFDPLKDVADKYGLDLKLLMADLVDAVSGEPCDTP